MFQYKCSGRVTAELVDTEADTTADEQLVAQYRMSSYIDRFTDPDVSSCEDIGEKPVFLSRCRDFFQSLCVPREASLLLLLTRQ